MGCAISAPKVKESKSPARKVSADAGSSASQRRPATGSSAAAQPASVATAPPAPVVAAPVPSSEAPPKEQPSLGKVPSARLKPSAQAPVQQEEAPEKKKERATTAGERSVVPRPVPKSLEGEHIAAGWPSWLASVAGEAIKGWIPRRADSFEKLDKIGQGTYSNVYKARDLESGKIVALKKVRFDNLEPESVRFMAREIEVLRRLDHPNIVKLEGLVTSHLSSSLYLVFEYMEHDLAGLAASPGITFAEEQVKCYMQQLLRGLEHCHTNGVLHRDIKGSNLLLDNSGILKIADFGLATFYRPEQNVPLTSRVVTLWYRPPELLLGATNYGVAVDLWSAGCILAELLAGKPIMPGRTEVEQLHKIFKLCGSPSEEYWRKSKLPHATIFKPSQPYKRNLKEIFKDFSAASLALLDVLLAIEPADRDSATAALNHEFFTTEPLPCDPSSLPEYPPSKEYDAKLRDEEARRSKAAGSRARGAMNDKEKRNSTSLLQQPPQPRQSKAVPAPHANAELMESIAIQKQNLNKHTSGPVAKSSSERFMGDNASQGAVGAGAPGVSSAQFKSIDTPEAVQQGGRPADRHLHRTGTNTRLGSLGGAGGPSNLSASWVAQGGQPGPDGGASIGKYPPGAPGADIGDRAMSMVRVAKGPPKDLSGGLQAGDVSFTQQKKVEAGEHGGFGVARNRTQSGEEKDLDLSFQGGAPNAKQGPPLGPTGQRPPSSGVAPGASGVSSASRKSGPLGSRDKVDPKTWMLTQAAGELPAGVAEALAAAREGAASGALGAESGVTRSTSVAAASRNGVVDNSPRGKAAGPAQEDGARPKSRGRDASPAKERSVGLADGSPRGKDRNPPGGKGALEGSPRGRGKAEAPPDTIVARAKKLQGVAASSSFVVGPDPSLAFASSQSSRGR